MSNNPFKVFYSIIVSLFIFIFLICAFFIPIIHNLYSYANTDGFSYDIDLSEYLWPVPGYTYISSYFGKRISPTTGASSYHKGLDIPAPPGTKLIAITDGTITFTNFLGGGGYTITLSKDNMKITYCHVSPNYIVSVGDKVYKGQVIGYVGPKNVYGVPGNTYKDSEGKPTNGATTGPHLHFGVRIAGEYINPFDLYNKNN